MKGHQSTHQSTLNKYQEDDMKNREAKKYEKLMLNVIHFTAGDIMSQSSTTTWTSDDKYFEDFYVIK